MTKKITERAFLGFAVGNLIGSFLNIVFSYAFEDGRYLGAMPQILKHFERDTDAVLVQVMLVGFIGVIFAESTLIFEIEKWSFLKKCLVHLLVTACFYVPFIIFCYLPRNAAGGIALICNIIFTYFLTWVIQYLLNRRDVRRINEKIREARFNERN